MVKNYPIIRRKKLIEVAIPLDVINQASAAEKQPGVGAHPRGLHIWWARRPLSAARGILFCQIVDDPSSVPELFPTEELQNKERERLFELIAKLVKWKNGTNKELIDEASNEIYASWKRCCKDNQDHPSAEKLFNPHILPPFHDPFAGGGAIPLEAQRLGLESHASDLNPVAVLINKATIEIPQKFSGKPPINLNSVQRNIDSRFDWNGSKGLSNDIEYYGGFIEKEAKKRIGKFFPVIHITQEIAQSRPDLKLYVGQDLPVITWHWARTVKSNNPAFSEVDVPLITNYMLSTKKGKEAYIVPVIQGDKYNFEIKIGKPIDYQSVKTGTKVSRGSNFKCLLSGSIIDSNYIKSEGLAGRLGLKLIAITAKGPKGRIYISPTKEHELIAKNAQPTWKPDLQIGSDKRALWTPLYGLKEFGDLFTDRQLLVLNIFSELVGELKQQIKFDSANKFLKNDNVPLRDGGTGFLAYKESIIIYLSFAISRLANYNSALSTWKPSGEQVMQTFKMHALPMTWDFPESNVFGESSICWKNCIKYTANNLESISPGLDIGFSSLIDAQSQRISEDKIISTDPPYFDNIGYADLSDYFYLWLRQNLKDIYPKLFATLTVPKVEELVAIPYRHENKEKAEEFFLNGMKNAMNQIKNLSHPSYPITIYYAFKQTEKSENKGLISTGWSTFLRAVLDSGLSIVGTWPIRTEMVNRTTGLGTNSLASSIVLVCDRKDKISKNISRNEFRRELRLRLPKAILQLENYNIAPVDLDQSVIGPGMEIYSQAKSVLNPDDSLMTVSEALLEINTAKDEYLSKDESELDTESRFALSLFETFGYKECDFGLAEGLAKARNIAVESVVKAGILKASGGKVSLIKRENLLENWDPFTDNKLCTWEATQYLIKVLDREGEITAGKLLKKLKNIPGNSQLASNCRSLAYRLFSHCEKIKNSEEARAYNGLIISWQDIEKISAEKENESTIQIKLI